MSTTPNLKLPLPDPAADVDDEFYRLQQTLGLLDAFIFALQTAVSGKAEASHSHTIEQINGLVAALQSKMNANKTFKIVDLTDVVGSADAALNYVLAKNNDGKFSFASALSLLGNHDHTIAQVVGLADALNARLLKAGGTMTGSLLLPTLVINGAENEYQQVIFSKDNVSRFNLHLDPSGNLTLNRYSTTGAYLGLALWIERLTGKVQIDGQLNALGGVDIRNYAILPSINGEAKLALGTGDGASYTTYNTILKGWWGMGMQTYDGSINGFYDFRMGIWDVKGGFRVNGNVVPHGGNKATPADIAAGTANKFPDAAAVKAALASFTSGQQTITNGGQLVIAHGLGSVPGNVSTQLVCVAADKGYNVGDIAFYPPMLVGFNGNAYGMTPVIDATNITLRISTAGFAAQNKTNGNADVLNSANWRLVVKAYP